MKTAILSILVLAGSAHAQAPAETEPSLTEAVPAAENPVPPPVAEPHAHAPPPAADDFDLSTLDLDPAAAFDGKLHIYGFADFMYQRLDYGPRSLVRDSKSFTVGNLNLYITKNLTARWRAFTEIRFLFSPNGGRAADGTITSTTTEDPANLYRPIEWGGIRIERAYLEYDLHPRLTVRAGHWLSPYGIWNEDHGSPAIIPTYRPYVIGEQFIPEHQTGLHAFGSTYIGEYKVGYHATVSNGRTDAEATEDPDGKLAFGGRLEVEAPWAGTVNLGVSGYTGRATRLGGSLFTVPVTHDEVAYAADVAWRHGGLIIQGEAMLRTRNYVVGQRAALGAGFQPDGRDVGTYVLAGYRFNTAWNVMPFAMAEYYNPLVSSLFDEVAGYSVGVNFRPVPTVVLKAMATIADTEGVGAIGELGRIVILGTQAAWVF